MLVRSPIVMGLLSDRITAPNQMLTFLPSRASPMMSAVGAIQLDPSSGRAGLVPSSSYKGMHTYSIVRCSRPEYQGPAALESAEPALSAACLVLAGFHHDPIN